MKRLIVVFSLLALLGIATPAASVVASSVTNPTSADCMGNNISMLSTHGYQPPDAVFIVNNDGDPGTNAANSGDFNQQLHAGKFVSANFNSGGYLPGCSAK